LRRRFRRRRDDRLREHPRGDPPRHDAGLAPRPDCAVVDAVPLRGLGFPCLGLVRGDSLSYAVACASILAKVERDALMVELDATYPHYGFAHHKGYAAPEHLEALREYGPTAVHRLTFRAVVPREGETIH
jgi:ribonuclease HII